jgi:hypothetical protein
LKIRKFKLFYALSPFINLTEEPGGTKMKKNLIIITILIISSMLVIDYIRDKHDLSQAHASSSPVAIITAPKNNAEIKPSPKEIKYFSPYTSEEISKTVLNNAPFMVIVENSRDARPQSGLSEADIVYETMAEGGIPRFMALFQANSPKEIGPVRSARPYFISLSKQYKLPFGHCGGSEEALISIKNEGLMSLNEITNSSYYWRDKSRKAPHNLYTSAQKLRGLAAAKGYVKSPSFGHGFSREYWIKNSLPAAHNVVLTLNKYYSTAYEYRNGVYYKSMDRTPMTDKSNNKPVSVSNIVIQTTDINLKPNGIHVDIRLTGQGSGYLISNGKYIKINWSRRDESSPTVLTDVSGKIVPLSPGKTWWHITDKNAVINIK